MHGQNYITAPIQFGSVHLVNQLPAKRHNAAIKMNESNKYIPKTEIGVCVGPNPLTKSSNFLTYGGHIGPKASHLQLAPNFIPFDFNPKDYVPFSKLPKYINNVPISPDNKLYSNVIQNTIFNNDLYSQPPPGLTTKLSLNVLPNTADSIINTSITRQPHKRVVKPVKRFAFYSVINTLTRKHNNARMATARNRAYRNTLNLGNINNNFTMIRPTPQSRNIRAEVNCKEAVNEWGYDATKAGEDKELKKLLTTYNSYKIITPQQIQPNAAFIPSLALYKKKRDGTISCRIPSNGSKQPSDTYGPTHAITTDTTDSLFLLSLSLKHAYDTDTLNDLFKYSATGDVPAGFINGIKRDLEAEGYRQLITKLPKTLLNQHLAGQLCEIIGPQYGLVDSNHIFDENINKVHKDIYSNNDINPRIYFKWNEGKFIFIRLYVDDFQTHCNSKLLRDEYNKLQY